MIGITHLAITVKDMDKSLDFYCRVLGIKKVFDLPDPKTGSPWIVYLHMGANQFVELFYNGTVDNPWDSSLRGFNHICFEVDDIQRITNQIKQAGYPLDREPQMGADTNWQAWVTDPDGIRIELMQIGPDSPQGKLARGLPV